MADIQLSSIVEQPHWRVRFRPETYNEQLIPKLSQCFEVIQHAKVSIRGWDYPHLSSRDSERQLGTNWIASWSDFYGHNEYWRFYQSGQFVHLFGVQEATNADWGDQLRASAKGHSKNWRDDQPSFDWNKIPGFISVLNFLYTITEIFEFSARLCQAGIYRESLHISVEVKRIKGFMLVHEPMRVWMTHYTATDDNLGREWTFEPQRLVTQSREISLDATVWFFERFGWLNPSNEVLRADQENFLMRRF